MNVFKWALAGAGGLIVAGLLAVTALGSGVSQAEEPVGSGARKAGAFTEALAGRLGIGVDELKAHRQASLDQVLADAVAAGRITPEQAEKIREHPVRGAMGLAKMRVAGVAVFHAAAETLGMDVEALKEELASGKSLAEIAAAQSISVGDLKAGMIAEIDAQLDQAVATGNLTQERADSISSKLAERLDKIIEHKRGQ